MKKILEGLLYFYECLSIGIFTVLIIGYCTGFVHISYNKCPQQTAVFNKKYDNVLIGQEYLVVKKNKDSVFVNLIK